MKTTLLSLGLVSLVQLLSAQTLQENIVKTDNENFETAAAGFRALIAKEPTKGENYFYYGENFFRSGDVDSAEMMYNKGIELNATNPLNYVGLGKVLLSQNKVNDAKAQFYKASTLSAGKNAEVIRKTAEAWLVTSNKDADEALKLMPAAIKLESKNPENYIILGDAQLEKNPTVGAEPIKSYQKATELNSKSTKGILREGKLYQRAKNYQLALDYYKKAIGIDPSFAPAYREIAELYSLAGQPAKSIENWKEYLKLNNSDFARYRFMSALFSNKQYADAVKEYEVLKAGNFTNVYLERLAGYSYAEMGNKTDTAAYTKGLAAINAFFASAGPKFKYLASDFKYKGLLLSKLGQDSLGIVEMEKAIGLDSSMAGEIYSTIGSNALRARNYDAAIQYYNKKKNNNYKNLNIGDCFDLGKAHYFRAASHQKELYALKEELTKKKKPTNTPEVTTKEQDIAKDFALADSAFKSMVALNPSWPWGYTWRGRANFSLDPKVEGDSTKAYYEKVIELVKPEERTGQYKANVIEAYEYLGYYYVTKKDEVKAKEMWLIVQELDPSNEKANNYLNPKKPAAGTAAPKK